MTGAAMTWLLLIALAGMTFAYWRSERSLRRANSRLDFMTEAGAHVAERSTELAQYRRILMSSAGGVGKRISECREITEAIQRYAPELFTMEEGLIYWLEATDQFLCNLYEVYREEPDPVQDHCATARSAAIYQSVHEQTGLPLPPGRKVGATHPGGHT